MKMPLKPLLTLGPLYFHWEPEKRRDFYYRMADEADVDVVYLGETVCSKREPFFEPYRQKVMERLKKGGKQVVISTLALVTTEGEVAAIRQYAKSGLRVEANDVAAVEILAGKPFVVGPFINVLNEGTRDFLVGQGASRIVFPVEAPGTSIKTIITQHYSKTNKNKTKNKTNSRKPIETEVLVFGRQPLSIAMRCYAARAHGLKKDACKFSCGKYPDGLTAETVDGQKLLTVNGTQTMTHGYVALLKELGEMQKTGVTHFRLSPHDMDMVQVAALYRAMLDGIMTPKAAETKLRKTLAPIPLINGFYYGKEGMAWIG